MNQHFHLNIRTLEHFQKDKVKTSVVQGDLFIYLLCLAYCFTLRAPHSLRIALTVYLVIFMIYGEVIFYIVRFSSTEKYFCG